jgi:hypothetical protein
MEPVLVVVGRGLFSYSLHWTGSGYALWWSERERSDEPARARLVRLGRLGEVVGRGPIREFAQDPVTAWNGEGYGIIWFTPEGELFFQRLGPEGEPAADEILVSGRSGGPVERYDQVKLLWTGTGYVAVARATVSGQPELYMSLLDEDGARLDDDVQVTDLGADMRDPFLVDAVWADGEIGISWSAERELDMAPPWDSASLALFSRVTPGADTAWQALLSVEPYGWSQSFPRVAWSGLEYGLAWGQTYTGSHVANTLLFQRVGRDASMLAEPPVLLSGSARGYEDSSIAWYGHGFALFGPDEPQVLTLAMVDRQGRPVARELAVHHVSFAWDVRLVWNGDELGATWAESYLGLGSTYELDELYFARIGLCE